MSMLCFCVDSSFPCFLIFKFFIIRRRNFKFLHCKSNRSGILSMVNEVFDAIFHLNLIFNSCLYFSSHSNFLILHIWQWFSFWKFKYDNFFIIWSKGWLKSFCFQNYTGNKEMLGKCEQVFSLILFSQWVVNYLCWF